MARNRWQDERYRGEGWQTRQGRGSGSYSERERDFGSGYRGRSHTDEDWGYPRSERPHYGRGGDDWAGSPRERDLYYGRERGHDPSEGYVGFGPEQGFWRSSNPYGEPDHGHRRDYGRQDRDNERGWWDRASDEVASWMGDEGAERRRRADELRSHRGRGPRGYTRSDERIRDDINDRLTDDWVLDASDIEVTVSNGEVTLSGTIGNRSDKRRAEDLAEDVSGVRHVQNNLRVRETQPTPTSVESSGHAGTTTRMRK